MKILALDPGGTTGLAWRIDGIYGWKALVDAEPIWKEVLDAQVCIVEQFSTTGPVSKYGFQTVRLIGNIEAICWLRGIEYIKTYPSRRMPFVQKATAMVGKKKATIHEVVALSHLFWWEEHNILETSGNRS